MNERTKHHDDLIKEFHRYMGDLTANMLVKTPISPTHVTIIRFLFGVIAAYLIAEKSNDYNFSVIAAFCLYLFSMLDAADGSLAKKQGTGTVFGAWLDRVSDSLGFLLFFIGIAYHFYTIELEPIWSVITMLTLVIAYMNKSNNHAIRARPMFSDLLSKKSKNKSEDQELGSHKELDLKTKIKRQLGPDFHKISAIIIFGLLVNDLKLTIVLLLSFLSAWWIYRTTLVLIKAAKAQ